MNNETKKEFDAFEQPEIDGMELETIAATLPVRTNLRAGAVKQCD
jgi:hypothetical protein